MSKLVRSKDSRKAPLIAFFKAASGGSKITQVFEKANGVFTANAFKHLGGRKYLALGSFTIEHSFANTILEPSSPVVSGSDLFL